MFNMTGRLVRSLCLSGLWLAGASAQVATTAGDPQRVLAGDLTELNARLNASRTDGGQVIADANRLAANYRGLVPYVGRFGPADYTQNRQLARQTFAWLAHASALYASDPAVMQALAGVYGYLGGFYSSPAFSSYPYAAATAYAGANRLTRSLLLGDSHNSRLEADLQRLGLAWATASYVGGRFYGDGLPEQAEPPQREATAAEIQPVALPDVEVEKLTPEQVGQWREVRERFVITSARVHESRVLLEQLAARLRSQNMSLNTRDVAAGLMMQGFLDDSASLMRAGQFELAKEGLVRAEYQRRKLKGVTGQ